MEQTPSSHGELENQRQEENDVTVDRRVHTLTYDAGTGHTSEVTCSFYA